MIFYILILTTQNNRNDEKDHQQALPFKRQLTSKPVTLFDFIPYFILFLATFYSFMSFAMNFSKEKRPD